jgi:outer membrane protein assembly factor BamB
MRRVFALAVLLAVGAAAQGIAAPRSYQIDPAHSGRVPGGGPAPALKRIWERRLEGALSYAVLAEGRVFVSSRRTAGSPVHVYALDRASGRTLWRRALGPATHGELAYDDGRLFISGYDDLLRALDARTGRVAWIDGSGPFHYFASPVARDGRVFVEGGFVGSSLLARRASDGEILWSEPFFSGNSEPVAVDRDRVYRRDCAGVEVFGVADGSPSWSHYARDGCKDFVDEPAAVLGDRLVLPNVGSEGNGMLVFPRAGPEPAGRVPGDPLAPVRVGSLTIGVEGGALTARGPDGTQRWRIAQKAPFAVSPLAGRGRVYAATRDGRVLVVDAASGRVRWRGHARGGAVARLPTPFAIQGGLAADAGLLVVPAGRRLTAFARARPRRQASGTQRGASLPARAPRGATHYQLDAAHRGWSPRGLRLPLRVAWSQPVGETPSYPLIADGRVFVASRPLTGEDGPRSLLAVDAGTGRALWSQPLPQTDFIAAAYHAGVVIVVADGDPAQVAAYAAADGRRLWSRDLPHDTRGEPAAADGTVYITYGPTAEALDVRTGATRWSNSGAMRFFAGEPSGVAIARDRLFISDACDGAVALRRGDGAELWRAEPNCTHGSGGPAPIAAGPHVLFPDTDNAFVRDPRSGRLVDTLASDPHPAVGPRITVATSTEEIVATDSRTRRVLWSAAGPEWMNYLQPPLLLGRHAWVTDRRRRLMAYDARTGRRVFSRRLTPPRAVLDPEPSRLAAAGGLLVVATPGRVFALRGARRAR